MLGAEGALVWNQGPTISGPVGQPVTEETASSAHGTRGEPKAGSAWLCVRPHMPELEWLSKNMKATTLQT